MRRLKRASVNRVENRLWQPSTAGRLFPWPTIDAPGLTLGSKNGVVNLIGICSKSVVPIFRTWFSFSLACLEVPDWNDCEIGVNCNGLSVDRRTLESHSRQANWRLIHFGMIEGNRSTGAVRFRPERDRGMRRPKSSTRFNTRDRRARCECDDPNADS
jgi:hypothetical protein